MKKAHRPFLYITGFFAIGIALDQWVRCPFSYLCSFVIVFMIAAMGTLKKENISTVLLLLALLCLGAAYNQARRGIDRDHIMSVAKYYRRQPILVRGVVGSFVREQITTRGAKTTFTLNVHQVKANWGWEASAGKILVNIFRDTDIAYGDYLQIEGKLHRPYNFSSETNFSYRDYLQNRGIYFILSVKKNSEIQLLARNRGSRLKSYSLILRQRLCRIFSDHLTKNEAGIMKAILLGDRSTIVKPVRALFVQTGTAHILAISGLHIGVVAAIFLLLVKLIPIGGKWQSAGAIGLLIFYAFLTGGRPSVVRATIMMVVFLASYIIEKERDVLNTLSLAAMIILVYNPLNLFDIGFQLSFVCVLSIIFLNIRFKKTRSTRPFRKKDNPFDRLVQCVLRSIAFSTAIWIGVAGFIVYYFGIITPVTIVANLLIVPFISVIVTLGFGLLICGMVLPSLAALFAMCLKIALNAMVGIIFLFDKVPFAYVYVSDVKIWHVATYYFVLSLMLLCPWKWLWFKLKGQLSSIYFHLKLKNPGAIDK